MSPDPKEVVRRFFEAFSRQDPDEIASYVTEDLIHHGSTNQGRDGVKEEARYWINAVPDASFTIDEIISEGDRVAVRGRGGGTHLGEFFGVRGTGNKVVVEEMHFARVENGLIAELWSNVDVYGLLAQIGAIPTEETV